jgi:hypothetical protein
MKLKDYPTEGINHGVMREIACLRCTEDSSNIVPLQKLKITPGVKPYVDLFFPRYKYTLKKAGIHACKVPAVVYQILVGLLRLKRLNIMHRDLKPENILVQNADDVVIADFGLSRWYTETSDQPFSNEVVSLSYRAPELLLGSVAYSSAIDIWSLGCILSELYTKRLLFNVDSEIGALMQIFKRLGHPTEDDNLRHLPNYSAQYPQFEAVFKKSRMVPIAAFKLLKRIFVLNPDKRPTVEDCMQDPFFDAVRANYEIRHIEPLLPAVAFSQQAFAKHSSVRQQVITCLFDACTHLRIDVDIFFVACSLMDRFAVQTQFNCDWYAVGISVLVIACKTMYPYLESIQTYIRFFNHKVSVATIVEQETILLQTLDFRLFQDTCFQKLARLCNKPKASAMLCLYNTFAMPIANTLLHVHIAQFLQDETPSETIAQVFSHTYQSREIVHARSLCKDTDFAFQYNNAAVLLREEPVKSNKSAQTSKALKTQA